jgi:hypothetical protein
MSAPIDAHETRATSEPNAGTHDAGDTVARSDAATPDLDSTLGHWGERVGSAVRTAVDGLQRTGIGRAGDRHADASDAPDTRMRHAERLVDGFTSWAGRYGAGAIGQVRRLASRAREEVEDIWAEAQATRHQSEGAGMATRSGEALQSGDRADESRADQPEVVREPEVANAPSPEKRRSRTADTNDRIRT